MPASDAGHGYTAPNECRSMVRGAAFLHSLPGSRDPVIEFFLSYIWVVVS